MINRVQALSYKALKFIDIRLKPFNILVGPNASGKSTFLDIFAFIQDILTESPVYAIEHRSADFIELVWNQENTKFEIVVEFLIPKRINQKFDLARYEIALAKDEKEGIIIRNENLFLIKSQNGNSQSKQNSVKQITLFPMDPVTPEHIVTSQGSVGWRKIISKSEQGNDYFFSETTKWNIHYRFGRKKSSLSRIPEDEVRFPISLWVKKILSEGIRYIQLNSLAMRKSCRTDAPSSLQLDGSNLPKVIKYLMEKDNLNFKRWVDHINSAVPEIEDIGVHERSEDRSLYVYAKQKGNLLVPSWLLSDGILRLLAQTIIAYIPINDQIYIIEEPENGLHPLAIESMYQSLSSVYENQVLLATHSPSILRLAKLEDILCFSKTEKGAVDIVQGENHPRLQDWKNEVDLATLHAAGVLQ